VKGDDDEHCGIAKALTQSLQDVIDAAKAGDPTARKACKLVDVSIFRGDDSVEVGIEAILKALEEDE
jgi:uncharacterized Zn-binding protein involved in type VI secretion